VAAATRAFAERGYTATTMREIALAVGMTQPGLSHHFPSKEALLEAVLAHRQKVGIDYYASSGLGALDTLRAIARNAAHEAGLVHLTLSLSVEAISPQHPAHGFYKDSWRKARKVFTALIERGQKAGEVRDDIAASELAALVVGVFEGLQLQWLTDPKLDLEASLEPLVRLLEPCGKRPQRKR
jgi:AcrR family transcriptional regulator